MHVARAIFILFLILVTLFTYGLQTRGDFSHAWQMVRPEVLEWMDGFYAAFRSLIAGTKAPGGIHDPAPGVNFEEVITMKSLPAN